MVERFNSSSNVGAEKFASTWKIVIPQTLLNAEWLISYSVVLTLAVMEVMTEPGFSHFQVVFTIVCQGPLFLASFFVQRLF